jgi:hypothetical protein
MTDDYSILLCQLLKLFSNIYDYDSFSLIPFDTGSGLSGVKAAGMF